ncbi:MAG: ABC transporter ATP-binding protein [Lachnospiraceae bacterium]|nr:ABC transporter ATP-binding protein [Lachnospiraceae bacterium]
MELVITAEHLFKEYRLYQKPADRLVEAVTGGKVTRGKKHTALRDLSFSVKKGEAFGIIGSNGAGKSTLLKICAGVLMPDAGVLRRCGKVSALLELGAGFHPDYTGAENVLLAGRVMGIPRRVMEERLPDILEFAGIGAYAEQPVKTYSSGMFARLAFAAATNVDADILIVDEALSVGDIYFQNRCFRRFAELIERGVTLLLVSHDLETVRRMTSRALWIEKGTAKMCGESREVCNAYAAEIHRKENEDHLKRTKKEAECGNVLPDAANCRQEDSPIIPPGVPEIVPKAGDILSGSVRIIYCYFENAQGEAVSELTGGTSCRLVIVFETKEKLQRCIAGFVLQNRKGVSIINSNTLTVQGGKPFPVQAGSLCRTEFAMTFPVLYRDVYLVDCAVADGGSVMENEMKTWIYGALSVTVHPPKTCLAIMDIPQKVTVRTTDIGMKESMTADRRSGVHAQV